MPNVEPEFVFSKDKLPNFKNAEHYQLKYPVHAFRIPKPFRVKTAVGSMLCEDGYLMVNSEGYPIAITKKDFEKRYIKLNNTQRLFK